MFASAQTRRRIVISKTKGLAVYVPLRPTPKTWRGSVTKLAYLLTTRGTSMPDPSPHENGPTSSKISEPVEKTLDERIGSRILSPEEADARIREILSRHDPVKLEPEEEVNPVTKETFAQQVQRIISTGPNRELREATYRDHSTKPSEKDQAFLANLDKIAKGKGGG